MKRLEVGELEALSTGLDASHRRRLEQVASPIRCPLGREATEWQGVPRVPRVASSGRRTTQAVRSF